MLCLTKYAACLAVLTTFCSVCSAQDPAAEATDKLFKRVVSNDELARYRGGAGALNFMDLEAALQHNSARANVSGNNSISTGAFSNASGFSTVIQNSGNNVIIQNATILNLDLR